MVNEEYSILKKIFEISKMLKSVNVKSLMININDDSIMVTTPIKDNAKRFDLFFNKETIDFINHDGGIF